MGIKRLKRSQTKGLAHVLLNKREQSGHIEIIMLESNYALNATNLLRGQFIQLERFTVMKL